VPLWSGSLARVGQGLIIQHDKRAKVFFANQNMPLTFCNGMFFQETEMVKKEKESNFLILLMLN
jgi:hypothetical protein